MGDTVGKTHSTGQSGPVCPGALAMHFAFVKLTRLRIEAMSYPNRPIAFVMASSNHGNLIVNRHDYDPIL
jgi:hypothetical protein